MGHLPEAQMRAQMADDGAQINKGIRQVPATEESHPESAQQPGPQAALTPARPNTTRSLAIKPPDRPPAKPKKRARDTSLASPKVTRQSTPQPATRPTPQPTQTSITSTNSKRAMGMVPTITPPSLPVLAHHRSPMWHCSPLDNEDLGRLDYRHILPDDLISTSTPPSPCDGRRSSKRRRTK